MAARVGGEGRRLDHRLHAGRILVGPRHGEGQLGAVHDDGAQHHRQLHQRQRGRCALAAQRQHLAPQPRTEAALGQHLGAAFTALAGLGNDLPGLLAPIDPAHVQFQHRARMAVAADREHLVLAGKAQARQQIEQGGMAAGEFGRGAQRLVGATTGPSAGQIGPAVGTPHQGFAGAQGHPGLGVRIGASAAPCGPAFPTLPTFPALPAFPTAHVQAPRWWWVVGPQGRPDQG